jgi:hypothetical protein
MTHHGTHLSRRVALKGMAGLVLGVYLPSAPARAQLGAGQILRPRNHRQFRAQFLCAHWRLRHRDHPDQAH